MRWGVVLKGFWICFLGILIILYAFLISSPCIEDYPITADYSSIKSSLRTGDLIFFCGSYFEHSLVRFATECPVSHVGMIVRGEKTIEHPEGEIYLFESSVEDTDDYLTETQKSGPVLYPFSEKLLGYSNHRFMLMRYLGDEIPYTKFIKFANQYHSTRFNTNIYSWYRAVFSDVCPEDKKTKFCSQLIAEAISELIVPFNKPFIFSPSRLYGRYGGMKPYYDIPFCFSFP